MAMNTSIDIRRKKDLREVAEDVQASREPRILMRGKKEPVAAVVPLEMYEQWKKDRDTILCELFSLMDEAAENANLSPEEADTLAQEAVKAVRATGS
jgi:hypothetical protein